jgi:hypothetical protein
MNLIKFFLIAAVISFVYVSCTDNPFFTDKEFWSDKLVVRGNVELNNSSDNSGVYVWLEGLNASTYTKSDGQFELKLPSPASLPGGATAWNGVYNLYYYLANYEYEFSSVLIRNGKVEYGNNDVDISGNIKDRIQLMELLGIKTTISPCSTRVNYVRRQKIEVSFTTYDKSVFVETFVPVNDWSGCIIFKNIDDPYSLSIFVLANSNEFKTIKISGSEVLNMKLGGGEVWDIEPIPAESGDYEIVPFVLIEQEGLPEELLLSLSKYYKVFSSEYLKIPFKWEADTFKVK